MEAPISFTVKQPARCLRAVPTASGCSQWLVGTNALREENEVVLLEYDPSTDTLASRAAWVHADEVWDVACCPGAGHMLATVHSKAGAYGLTVWQASMGGNQLTPITQLQHDGVIRRVLWSTLQPEQLLSVEEGALRLWSINDAAAQASGSCSPGQLEQFWTAALHPRDAGPALAAAGNNVQLWDTRCMERVGLVENAHRMAVRDVSWAPHNGYRWASAGDDCKIRFWDTRMMSRPESLLELSGHSHWVWNAAFSPFHDSLLASSSTDTTVCAWYTPALARRKGPAADEQQQQQQQLASRPQPGGGSRQEVDGKVASYDEHEDSVYGLAWSSCDPWLFASMSYDGCLVVNKVPKSVKYKILI